MGVKKALIQAEKASNRRRKSKGKRIKKQVVSSEDETDSGEYDGSDLQEPLFNRLLDVVHVRSR